MGQCPATRYVDLMLEKIQKGEIDATDIISHTLSLEEGRYVYSIFDKREDNCIKVILKPINGITLPESTSITRSYHFIFLSTVAAATSIDSW